MFEPQESDGLQSMCPIIHLLYLLESLLLRALVHHSGKQGITGVLLNNRRLRVLVFSCLHTFFQGIVFQHPPTPMTWVGRCDALPCPPPPPPPQKSLVLDTLEVTVLSADESLSESKNGANVPFLVYMCMCKCVLKSKIGFMCTHS